MRTQPEYADNFGIEGTRDYAIVRGPGVKGVILSSQILLLQQMIRVEFIQPEGTLLIHTKVHLKSHHQHATNQCYIDQILFLLAN